VGLSVQLDTTMMGFMAILLLPLKNDTARTLMANTIKSILEIRQKNWLTITEMWK
jgi:hypothetical protein